MKVHIKTYDVWGNAEDGYEVSDTFSYALADFDGTEEELCNDTVGFLNTHYFANYVDASKLDIRIEDNGDYLDIEVEHAVDGKPLCELTVCRVKE